MGKQVQHAEFGDETDFERRNPRVLVNLFSDKEEAGRSIKYTYDVQFIIGALSNFKAHYNCLSRHCIFGN